MKKKNHFPKGWDQARVQRVLDYYENQTDDEAVAEIEAMFARPDETVIAVPRRMLPRVQSFVARLRASEKRKRSKSRHAA